MQCAALGSQREDGKLFKYLIIILSQRWYRLRNIVYYSQIHDKPWKEVE